MSLANVTEIASCGLSEDSELIRTSGISTLRLASALLFKVRAWFGALVILWLPTTLTPSYGRLIM